MQKGTIIIAAVVSMSASGLLSEEKSTPSVVATAVLTTGDGLEFTVTGTSEPVSPNDLQITLSMTKDGEYFSRTLDAGSEHPIITGTPLSFSAAKSLQTTKENKSNTITNITTLTIDSDEWNTVVSRYAKPEVWENTSNYAEGVKTWNYTDENGNVKLLKDYQYPISSWTKLNLKKVLSDNEGKNPITDMHEDLKWNYMIEMNEEYKLAKQSGLITKYDLYKLKPGDKVNLNIVYLPSGKPVYEKSITVGA